MSERDEWKRGLEPLADMVAAPMVWLWSDDRTANELKALRASAEKATNTNCWWATYQAAQIILDEVPRVLKERWGL